MLANQQKKSLNHLSSIHGLFLSNKSNILLNGCRLIIFYIKFFLHQNNFESTVFMYYCVTTIVILCLRRSCACHMARQCFQIELSNFCMLGKRHSPRSKVPIFKYVTLTTTNLDLRSLFLLGKVVEVWNVSKVEKRCAMITNTNL